MSEWSGSYQRFTADQHFPSTRPHNTYLNKVVVNGRNLTNHYRNLPMREENKNLNLVNARTLYDREPNELVNTDGTTGGSLAGWRKFKRGFLGVAKAVAPIAPLIL